MSRWERLFYYLEYHDRPSCITIHHLTASTPNLREVVISSSIHALALGEDISGILPETPNLKSLEISMPSIGELPRSFRNCKSVTRASIQTFDDRACIDTLSQLKSIRTLTLRWSDRQASRLIGVGMDPGSVKLPSVHTLILVGPLLDLQHRLWLVEFPALLTLEVDPTPPGGEKQWSGMENGEWDQIKWLLKFGVQKLVLKRGKVSSKGCRLYPSGPQGVARRIGFCRCDMCYAKW
jgi:hypothetical protein